MIFRQVGPVVSAGLSRGTCHSPRWHRRRRSRHTALQETERRPSREFPPQVLAGAVPPWSGRCRRRLRWIDGALWPSSVPSVLEVSCFTCVTISVARLARRMPSWILKLLLPRARRKMSACACKPSATICASAASHLHFERRADKTGKSAFGIRQFRVNDRNDGAIRS